MITLAFGSRVHTPYTTETRQLTVKLMSTAFCTRPPHGASELLFGVTWFNISPVDDVEHLTTQSGFESKLSGVAFCDKFIQDIVTIFKFEM